MFQNAWISDFYMDCATLSISFWVQFSTMLIWEKETGRRKLSGFRQAKLPNSLSGAMAQ